MSWRKLSILILLLMLIFFLIGGFMVMNYKQSRAIMGYQFVDINMDQVQDGNYIGEANSGMVYVKVEVVVEDHIIKGIEILQHEKGLGGKAEKMTKVMIDQNSYDVDGISGATVSSETIKYAVCQALVKGIE